MICKKCGIQMIASNTIIKNRIKFNCECGFFVIIDRGRDV
jgi:hypothetical protein